MMIIITTTITNQINNFWGTNNNKAVNSLELILTTLMNKMRYNQSFPISNHCLILLFLASSMLI